MENNENMVGTEQETVTTQNKTYTQAEVDEILQQKAEENLREIDRRVTNALKKQERNTADKVREAQRLAQMNEAEKFQYELEQREKAIVEKEKALALAENKNEASKILAEKGLSLALVDFVVAEDAETMNANISLLVKAFNQSVKTEVEKRLGSSTPKKNLPTDETITKEAFKNMDASARQVLAIENPDLYKSLSGRKELK